MVVASHHLCQGLAKSGDRRWVEVLISSVSRGLLTKGVLIAKIVDRRGVDGGMVPWLIVHWGICSSTTSMTATALRSVVAGRSVASFFRDNRCVAVT